MLVASVFCMPSLAVERCYKSMPPDNSSRELEPRSNVCRAFERTFEAHCDHTWEPRNIEEDAAFGLEVPRWNSIPLYTADGDEDLEGFDLLRRLVRARTIHSVSRDKEARAAQDVARTLAQVRQARSDGRNPRFERIELDLEGRGQQETLYRMSDSLRSELFLGRALDDPEAKEGISENGLLYGNSLVGPSAGVLLFEGTPYFVNRGSVFEIYVFAAYLERNRPLVAGESATGRKFLIPPLRCLFEPR